MHKLNQRIKYPYTGVRVIVSRLALLLVVLGASTLCCAAAHPPQWVKWEIEATVTDIVDPGGFFPDLRSGDPVRGTLKYDLTLSANPLFSGAHYYDYTNYKWAEVASMVIENPRTGIDTTFLKDLNGEYADVYVYNDQPDSGGDFDAIYAVQSVLPPPRFVGGAPVVAVQLLGQTSNLSNFSLPSQFDLNDWPLSAITFYDAYLEDEFATSIEAEIYSLTQTIIPAGDFDHDGDVDTDDFNRWRATYSSNVDYSGDANGDFEVDAADYVIWRKASGDAAGSGSLLEIPVPEPAALSVFIIGSIAMFSHRRRFARQVQQLINT